MHPLGMGLGDLKIRCPEILVTADLLGLTAEPPPFAPAYANLRAQITQAVAAYSQAVRGATLP